MGDSTSNGESAWRKPPSLQSVVILATCFTVIGSAGYFVMMDRADRAEAEKKQVACDRDRSFIQTMTAVGRANDPTVIKAREDLAKC